MWRSLWSGARTSCAISIRRWVRRTSRSCSKPSPVQFARLGQGGADGGCFLHNSTYDFNDAVIPLGAGYLAALGRGSDASSEMKSAHRSLCAFSRQSARASIRLPASRRHTPRRASGSSRLRTAVTWTVSHYVHPVARGVQGEELAIDVATLGRADAPNVLLLTSATHGVEGFCGSGCQLNPAARRRTRRRGPGRRHSASCSCMRSIRMGFRTCVAPTRTTSTSTATSATSRSRCAAQRRLRRGAWASSCPRRGLRRPRTRRG